MASAIPGFREGIGIIVSHIHYPALDLKTGNSTYLKSELSRSFKIILHREIEGMIKTCTIKKDIDQWYVAFSCEIDIPVIPVEIKSKTGIDVGLSSIITMSNGSQIEPLEFLKASEKRLSREQIHLSKKNFVQRTEIIRESL